MVNTGKALKSLKDQLCWGDKEIISEYSMCVCPVKLLKGYLSKFQMLSNFQDLIVRPYLEETVVVI